MVPLPRGKVPRPEHADAAIEAAAGFANAVADILTRHPEDTQAKLEALLARAQDAFRLEPHDLGLLIGSSVELADKYAVLIGYGDDAAPFLAAAHDASPDQIVSHPRVDATA